MEIAKEREGLPPDPEARGPLAEDELSEDTLAAGVAMALERLIGLFRSLSPASGLSLTAAATLATLERLGPCRLTWLAAREGVTQPALTPLIARPPGAGPGDRGGDTARG